MNNNDNNDRNHDLESITTTPSHQHKKTYFGIPGMGLFFMSHHPTTRPENEPLLSDHQEIAAPPPASYGCSDGLNNLDSTIAVRNDGQHHSSQQPKQRSGKELWSILRRHVQHESFHIAANIREPVAFDIQTVGDDIPYDFTLVHCFWALVVYLVVSIIAYSFVFESWSPIDSMYFAVVTFTTIGYGDFAPTTRGGKLFNIVFALGGVAVLAIALGVVGSAIIESQVQTITKAEDDIVHDVFRVFSRQQRKSKQERQAMYARKNSRESTSFDYLSDLDDPLQSFHDELEDAVHPWHATMDWCTMFWQLLARYIPALTPLFLGAFLIGHFEGWSWDDVLYYCVVTSTSIGYGDFTPQSESMRLFAVLFIPLAVGAMGHFLGTIASFIVEQRTRVFHKKLWKHELTLEDLQTMSHNSPDGCVSELDFVVFMLQAMKKVDAELIDKIRHHFQSLDVTHNGTLDREDLELMAKRKLRGGRQKLKLAAYKQQLFAQRSFCEWDSHHHCASANAGC